MKSQMYLVIGMTVFAGCLASVAEEPKNDYRNLTGFPKSELAPLVVERVWPKNVGEAAVCLWKDDKTVAFSVTMDDNIKSDHAWWLEQGKKFGFRFTWFVIVNNILTGVQNAGTWADFQGLINAGHDVQSHTWSHRNDKTISVDEDYSRVIPVLGEKLTGTKPLTMAYAGGALPNDPAVGVKYFAGARGGIGTANGPRTDWLNVNSVSSVGGIACYNIPVGTKGDWASLLPLLDPKNKNYRGWYCTHFHWMGDKADDKHYVTGKSNTVEFLEFMKNHESDYWMGLFREVVLYGQERDTAKLQVTSSTPVAIKIVLTDRMYDEWFDFPLTVRVHVPDSWKTVHAVQGGKPIHATVAAHEGQNFVMVDIVPDKGEAVLTPQS